MKYLALLIGALGAVPAEAAPRPFPVTGLWVQIAFAAPGTNDTRRVDVAPGAVTPPVSRTPVIVPVPMNPGLPEAVRPAPSGGASPLTPGAAPDSGGGAGVTQISAGRASVPAGCQVAFPKTPELVPALGGVVELQLAFTPPSCATDPVAAAPWIERLPGEAFRFSVAPNPSSEPRQGAITLGPHRFLIHQEAGKAALFAASPSRIVLAMRGAKAPKRVWFSVWTEDPALGYTVAPVGGSGWLAVQAEEGRKPAATRKFAVTVRPGALGRGRHEAEIRVAATGVASSPLRIPVIVEVR